MLAPAVRAEDLSDGEERMPKEMHEMMHQVMDGTMTSMEMHDKMHQMMDGMAMSKEMHKMMHQVMDGTMTPMEMHDNMHQMMDGAMMMPATGAPAGPVLVLLTALGLIGLGVLSRLGGHGMRIRYGNRRN
jgi:hypothetical protein